MTPRQRDVLIFINNYWLENHCAPTMRIISKALGLSSHSNIHRIVHRLVKDGYLSMKRGRPRTMQIAKMPMHMMVELNPSDVIENS